MPNAPRLAGEHLELAGAYTHIYVHGTGQLYKHLSIPACFHELHVCAHAPPLVFPDGQVRAVRFEQVADDLIVDLQVAGSHQVLAAKAAREQAPQAVTC
eukprot:1161622-Pelagomonas_calceolata.AAC.18